MYFLKYEKYNSKINLLYGGGSEQEYKRMADNFEVQNEKIKKEIEYVNSTIQKEITKESETEMFNAKITEISNLITDNERKILYCEKIKQELNNKNIKLNNLEQTSNFFNHQINILQKKVGGGIGKEEARFLKLLDENTKLTLKKSHSNNHLNEILDNKMKKKIEMENLSKRNENLQKKVASCESSAIKLEKYQQRNFTT
jgi:hypothetical protein